MKRVLILGLYFPPANFSAARRLEGWSKHLSAFGYEPLVLTRYYDPEERNTGDFYASTRPTLTLHERWIETEQAVYTNFTQSSWGKIPLPGKVRGLGHFIWPDPDHSGWFRQCYDYLKTSKFKPDIIIGSHSPVGVFRVARKLAERLDVPWVADFRDLWLQSLNGDLSSKLKLSLQRRHLRTAGGITVTNEGTVEQMRQQLAPLEKPIRAIYTGAELPGEVLPDDDDRETLEEFERIKAAYSIVLTYPGTLYSEQRVERFLNTIADFNESGRGPCAVVLYGKHDPALYQQWPFVKVLGQVGHNTSLFLQRNSTALFYSTWPASAPFFAGKIFELIASGRPVLVGFTPSPDLESFCLKVKSVSVIKQPEELMAVLNKLPQMSMDASEWVVPPIATKKYWAGELARFLDEVLAQRKKIEGS
jgi:hypothetical protein